LATTSVQDALLTAGLTVGLTSGALLLYRWRLMRLALHMMLLCVPIELFYRTVYRGPISPGVILSIAETSLRETHELLAGHALVSLLLIPLTALAVYAAFASWAAESPFAIRRCVVAGAVGMAMITGSLVIAHEQSGSRAELPGIVKDGLKATFPIDIAHSLQVVVTGLINIHRASAARANFSFQNVRLVNEDTSRSSPEIYVIIIGEASRRADWSLYGYGRPTTARLDAIRHDLIVFDRATSNATVTILSIPLTLTRATPANFGRASSEKSIIALLRQGGYTVDWISNQEQYGRNQNPTSAIALEANSASFPEPLPENSGGVGFDSNLMKRMNDELARSPDSAKTVVFLHMMGSHFRYGDRYPANFAKFHGVDDLPRKLQQWQMQLVNEYDNSVYFTDYIVRQVIERLKMCQCKAGLIYFSDHGERLFDNGMNDDEFGHGFPTVSRQEIEIPFFMWLSRSYRDANPALISRLEANAHAAVELHSVFETIVDLTGLTYDGRVAATSLFAESYRPPRSLEVLNMSAQRVFFAVDGGDAWQHCIRAHEPATDAVSAVGAPAAACLQTKNAPR
jgi:glucan phosphoethanolaminetransferase (alkaline phosphatase superfamily)